MSTPTVKGFIEFAKAQPAEQLIDQSCWSTCAIGDYCRTCDDYEEYRTAEGFFYDPDNYAVLGSPGIRVSICLTYGDIHERMEKAGL